MAISHELKSLLQDNLSQVQEPPGYAALRKKLMQSRPRHSSPVIKQSPENSLKIESSETE